MKLPVILGAMVSLAVSGVAQAAFLDSIHGGVRVNRGDGYVAVRGATELKPGDMVMVDAKGKARLVYPDNCGVSVKAGSVTVVGAKSPCLEGRSARIPSGDGAPAYVDPAESGLDTTGLVVGGLALAAVGGGIAAAALNGQPTSPPFIPLSPASP